MVQALQLAGAILILVGFIAAQRGAWSPQAVPYLLVNVIGAAVLAVVALIGRDWGFLLLEAVWTIVSIHGLVQAMLPRPHAP